MEFTKYDERGAYHWEEYANKNTEYSKYVDVVTDWVTERPVLDVGCGDGLITYLFGETSLGVDDNQTAIKLATEKGVLCNLKNAHETYYDGFNAIFLGDVIEHIKDYESLLKRIHSHIKKDAHLYITTPPARQDRKLQDKFHYFEWTPQEFKQEVEAQGFELVEPIFTKHHRMFGKFKKKTI